MYSARWQRAPRLARFSEDYPQEGLPTPIPASWASELDPRPAVILASLSYLQGNRLRMVVWPPQGLRTEFLDFSSRNHPWSVQKEVPSTMSGRGMKTILLQYEEYYPSYNKGSFHRHWINIGTVLGVLEEPDSLCPIQSSHLAESFM